MKDIQNTRGDYGFKINKVGVTDIKYPITGLKWPQESIHPHDVAAEIEIDKKCLRAQE